MIAPNIDSLVMDGPTPDHTLDGRGFDSSPGYFTGNDYILHRDIATRHAKGLILLIYGTQTNPPKVLMGQALIIMRRHFFRVPHVSDQ